MTHAPGPADLAALAGCPTCATASVLVVVPCHDEERTIEQVVRGFQDAVPHADILVGDNASKDATTQRALASGASVIQIPSPGKGRAIRRLLEHSDHDVTIMVDGDLTYDPAVAPLLVHEVFCRGYDMINVARRAVSIGGAEYRSGHRFGNAVLTGLQRRLTGIQLVDALSGYKALGRRFVASFPVRSRSFQVEVEIAAHAVALDLAYGEMEADYIARPEGSESKLSTYRDGWAILRAIFRLYRDFRPFPAFAWMALPWLLASLFLVGWPIIEYVDTGLVARFPSLIAGVAAFITGMLLLTAGWILDRTQSLRRDELAVAATTVIRASNRRRQADVQRPQA